MDSTRISPRLLSLISLEIVSGFFLDFSRILLRLFLGFITDFFPGILSELILTRNHQKNFWNSVRNSPWGSFIDFFRDYFGIFSQDTFRDIFRNSIKNSSRDFFIDFSWDSFLPELLPSSFTIFFSEILPRFL